MIEFWSEIYDTSSKYHHFSNLIEILRYKIKRWWKTFKFWNSNLPATTKCDLYCSASKPHSSICAAHCVSQSSSGWLCLGRTHFRCAILRRRETMIDHSTLNIATHVIRCPNFEATLAKKGRHCSEGPFPHLLKWQWEGTTLPVSSTGNVFAFA